MKERILKLMKEKCNFAFWFPVIMTYIVFPAGYAVKIYVRQTEVLDGIMLFMAVWWIMTYYDGKFKTAAIWLMRYIVMFLPLWIVYYVIYMNMERGFVVLFRLVRIVLMNTLTGIGAFWVKKIMDETVVVFVLLIILFIFIVLPPYMVML